MVSVLRWCGLHSLSLELNESHLPITNPDSITYRSTLGTGELVDKEPLLLSVGVDLFFYGPLTRCIFAHYNNLSWVDKTYRSDD